MDKRIEAVLAILESEYATPLKVRDLPKRVGSSRAHMEFLFKKETGLTLRACLRRVRLQKACALLEDRQLSIKEIAFSVGYGQPSNFDRDFKALSGKSPSDRRCEPHPQMTQMGLTQRSIEGCHAEQGEGSPYLKTLANTEILPSLRSGPLRSLRMTARRIFQQSA